MDLEQIHRGSRFEDYARTYFVARIGARIGNIPEALSGFWSTDLVGKEEEIMRIALEAGGNDQNAEAFFRAWLINTALEKMVFNPEFGREPYTTIAQAGGDLILENIQWFKDRELIK